jgi:tRNA-specific 2-thiouridylase
MSRKGRVLVAMSGGIDSSVAALMLHESGYEVIGVTMKTWDYASSGGTKKTTGCCSLDDINDARSLAVSMGFPHYIIDIREEFGEHIIEDFVNEYLAGRTPNPCVRCNTHIKWDALARRAELLDCDYIATGHYARVRKEGDRFVIFKGIDSNKDQSYVLWGLKQERLSRTIFPVGGFTKPEIRKIALESGFENIANKGESYEICFIPDNDYRSFIRRKRPEESDELKGGAFMDKQGNILGKHDGYPYFTVGQRKGLGMAFGKPVYVTGIDAERNVVFLGEAEELLGTEMWVRDVNLIKYDSLKEEHYAHTKIRYKDRGAPSLLFPEGNRVNVKFLSEVSAIAPGQSAVFYEEDDLIGGGFIEKSPNLVL